MTPKRSKKHTISEALNSDNSNELSQLPDVILQHILFFLPTEDAARVSALSKSWLRVWNSLPEFSFSFHQDQVGGDLSSFVAWVNSSLSPLQDQKAIIKSFTLNTSLCQEGFASNIDNWLSLVMRNYVKELSINLSGLSYTLPQATFASKLLVKLALEGCEFPATLAFADTKQEFNCLRELYLVNVVAIEGQIQNLVNCFPFLGKLTIKLRNKMKYLVLDDFQMLQYVEVTVKILRIDAPNLHTLALYDIREMSASNFTVNIKHLSWIRSSTISNGNYRLQNLVFRLLFLESLYLILSSNNRRFKVRHHHLKTLLLWGRFEDPMEVEIDTPKLTNFHCIGSLFLKLRVSSSSIKECNTFMLKSIESAVVDGSHIYQLGNCLQNFNPNVKVNLYNLGTKNLLTLAQLQEQEVISRPSDVRKLVLISIKASSDYTSFLDGLLWTCHPSTLVIKECSVNGDNFIRFLCRELLGREGNSTCCVGDLQSICWRHFLKVVKVEFYARLCDSEKSIESNNLSHTLTMCDTRKKVKFRFEWSEDPIYSSFQDFW